MTRDEAQKAVDAAFVDALTGEYKNVLITGLFGKPPRPGTDEAFREALAINLAAHAMASKAVAENPDLKD
jgi:hypothetical protein